MYPNTAYGGTEPASKFFLTKELINIIIAYLGMTENDCIEAVRNNPHGFTAKWLFEALLNQLKIFQHYYRSGIHFEIEYKEEYSADINVFFEQFDKVRRLGAKGFFSKVKKKIDHAIKTDALKDAEKTVLQEDEKYPTSHPVQSKDKIDNEATLQVNEKFGVTDSVELLLWVEHRISEVMAFLMEVFGKNAFAVLIDILQTGILPIFYLPSSATYETHLWRTVFSREINQGYKKIINKVVNDVLLQLIADNQCELIRMIAEHFSEALNEFCQGCKFDFVFKGKLLSGYITDENYKILKILLFYNPKTIEYLPIASISSDKLYEVYSDTMQRHCSVRTDAGNIHNDEKRLILNAKDEKFRGIVNLLSAKDLRIVNIGLTLLSACYSKLNPDQRSEIIKIFDQMNLKITKINKLFQVLKFHFEPQNIHQRMRAERLLLRMVVGLLLAGLGLIISSSFSNMQIDNEAANNLTVCYSFLGLAFVLVLGALFGRAHTYRKLTKLIEALSGQLYDSIGVTSIADSLAISLTKLLYSWPYQLDSSKELSDKIKLIFDCQQRWNTILDTTITEPKKEVTIMIDNSNLDTTNRDDPKKDRRLDIEQKINREDKQDEKNDPALLLRWSPKAALVAHSMSKAISSASDTVLVDISSVDLSSYEIDAKPECVSEVAYHTMK